jgi:hypothetical protein
VVLGGDVLMAAKANVRELKAKKYSTNIFGEACA